MLLELIPPSPTSGVVHESIQRSNTDVHKVPVLRVGLEEGRITGNVTVFLELTYRSQAAVKLTKKKHVQFTAKYTNIESSTTKISKYINKNIKFKSV